MSIASDALDIARFIKENSTEQAVQEAVNNLNIKIGDLATERIELLDTISDLKAQISQLKQASTQAKDIKSRLDNYRLNNSRGVHCYIPKDEKDASTASERYCPNCYKKGGLNQLSGIFGPNEVLANCPECGFSSIGH